VSERRGRDWAAVALVFTAIVVVTAWWHALDRRPPVWDYANHLESALRCGRELSAGDLGPAFARSSFYPPVVPCLAGLVSRAAPSDLVFGEIVMLAFLGVGMAAVHVLGRRLGGGGAGIVAATLFGTAPVVVHHVLHFQLDVPLAAMVATFLAVLAASDRFKRTGWTIAAGVVFGLGMLTKPPFLLFVGPSCLLVVAGARGRRAWLQAAGAAVLAVALSLPWYGPRALGLLTQIQNRSFKQAAEAGAPPTLTSASLMYYPLNVPAHFGLIAVVLLVVGIAVALRRGSWYALAGLAPGLVLLTLQNKQMRYALPLLPIVSVVAGLGFAALPGWARRAGAVVVAAAAVFQVASTAFALPFDLRLPLIGTLSPAPTPPDGADWRHRAILDLIVRDGGRSPRTVSIIANHAYFSPSNFRYYAVRDELPLRVARAWEGEPIAIEYMILKTGDLGPAWSIDKPRRVGDRLRADGALARAFPVIGEFPLPDGSTASVRARRLDAVADVAPEALARSVVGGLRARLAEVMRDVEGLDLRIEYDARILGGQVRRLEIAAAAATVGELRRRGSAMLRLHDLRLVLDDVLVNPWSAAHGRRFDPLDAGRVTVERASLDGAELQRFVGGVKGLGGMTVALGAGFIDLALALPGPDVTARVRFVPATDRPFALLAERVEIGRVAVPPLLVDWVMHSVDPSRGLVGRVPFPVELRPVTVSPRTIAIGAS
jgi:hypothetical protein